MVVNTDIPVGRDGMCVLKSNVFLGTSRGIFFRVITVSVFQPIRVSLCDEIRRQIPEAALGSESMNPVKSITSPRFQQFSHGKMGEVKDIRFFIKDHEAGADVKQGFN